MLKETPSEAQIVSHRLMLRCGMIRQSSAGIYTWLPLGLRVLRKIENIVREEQNRAGAIELLMPTIQSADLWKSSGRYEAYGKEMLRLSDRHDRELLYGPTNEELVTDIFAQAVKSYREMPLNLYHIQWKFRDEVRPRFGVMRGREFLMKDAYSFDVDYAGARLAYNKMFIAYLRTFARMGLKAIPMEAETGPIGGNLSHEFIILAQTGESRVFCDRRCIEYDVLADAIDYSDESAVHEVVERFTQLYACTDEKHDPAHFDRAVPEDRRYEGRGIEVGHVFYFGTKYSEPLGAEISGADGRVTPVHMGSYGIGVSRLVGALIEASHDEAGCVWPEPVAPFKVTLINLRPGDAATSQLAEQAYARLSAMAVDVLYDDAEGTPGAKFAVADLLGFPWQVIIGPRGAARGRVELKYRRSGERNELSLEDALARIAD
jgi:prolyl-tRNA synthetase